MSKEELDKLLSHFAGGKILLKNWPFITVDDVAMLLTLKAIDKKYNIKRWNKVIKYFGKAKKIGTENYFNQFIKNQAQLIKLGLPGNEQGNKVSL